MVTAENPRPERNLRHHLRVKADFPVTLTTRDNETCAGEIVNLSRTGLMVACNRETLERLMPNKPQDARFAPLHPVTVEASFALGLSPPGVRQLSCLCHIIHTRRLARDTFHVGLAFESLTPENKLWLEQFIVERKPG